MRLMAFLRSLSERNPRRRNQLNHQQRRLHVERLEDRTLLTIGTTIITHGFEPWPFDAFSALLS